MAQVWDAKDRSLAVIEPTDDPDDATAAARLVAAAPDLYEALKQLRAICSVVDEALGAGLPVDDGEWDGPMEAAQAALSKAVQS